MNWEQFEHVLQEADPVTHKGSGKGSWFQQLLCLTLIFFHVGPVDSRMSSGHP